MDQATSTEEDSPATFYGSRAAACQQEIRRRRRQHMFSGYLRLAWAATMLSIAWLAFVRHTMAWEWLAIPWLGFAVTAYFHAKVLAAGSRAERAVRWCEQGLARVEDRWAGLRPRTTRVDTSGSLYAADLDLFGPASIFELLCTARTSVGEDRLALWLLQPAERDEVLARQTAVAELRDRTALREDIASAPGPELIELDPAALIAWSEAQGPELPAWVGPVAPVLSLLTVACAIWWIVTHSPFPLIAMLVVDAGVTYLLQRRVDALFRATTQASASLASVANLLARFERESVLAPRLQMAQASLSRGAQPASRAILGLARLSRANVFRNGVLRLIDIPLLYSVQLGALMGRWKRTHGEHVRVWLDALAEVEALLSLSSYHFEHSGDPFPEFAENEIVFSAERLGHPLLPDATCVRNDVTLNSASGLLLVSGSNMSGKSTLLRAVGVSAVLAMAGAPVRAQRLRLSPVHIGASIQIHDSLQSGRSRFYAEILRLRAICDLARAQPPVLFLLDELLAGTNSRDRLTGARGVVRELLAAGAIGMLSTHDLALTEIDSPGAQHIRNVHFEDRINGDRLQFDYTLREGIVTRNNGVELMRLIGLDV